MPPNKTVQAWHLVLVERARGGEAKPFPKAKDEVKRALIDRRLEEVRRKAMDATAIRTEPGLESWIRDAVR